MPDADARTQDMGEADVQLPGVPDRSAGRLSRTPRLRPARRRLPIIYSTLSVEYIKRLVARQYDLGDALECVFFCRGVSDTYLLVTPERKFALKVYRSSWRTTEAILGEIAALRHVGGKGIDVALPVPRRDGSWIADIRAPEGLRRAVLFHWADGRAPKYTEAGHARQYGSLVARLHCAGEDLPASSARREMDIAYLFTNPMQRIRSHVKHLPQVAMGLEALAERTEAHLRRAAARVRDWGFCHGDVWTNNARLDGNRLVLFDFDFCGPGWRLFDLASYRWHARFTNVEEPAWPPFIAGYLEIRPEAAATLEFIGLFMILKHLWTTAHWIGRLPETGAYFLPDEYLENMVPFCEKIETDSARSS